MNSATAAESAELTASTSGFVLAATVAVLFNTGLAWARDAYAPLNDVMKSLTGNPWIAHGVAVLALFVGLGFIFTKTGTAGRVGCKPSDWSAHWIGGDRGVWACGLVCVRLGAMATEVSEAVAEFEAGESRGFDGDGKP